MLWLALELEQLTQGPGQSSKPKPQPQALARRPNPNPKPRPEACGKTKPEERRVAQDFFDLLYNGYTGEYQLMSSLYRNGLDALRPPADMGIDVVSLNLKQQLEHPGMAPETFFLREGEQGRGRLPRRCRRLRIPGRRRGGSLQRGRLSQVRAQLLGCRREVGLSDAIEGEICPVRGLLGRNVPVCCARC
mgnify:CR=1 FL=1